MTRHEKVDGFLHDKRYVPLKFRELVTVLDVKKEDEAELSAILDRLEAEGRIIKSKKGRYSPAEAAGCVTGTLSTSTRGFGFVIPDEKKGEDVFVPKEALGGAYHGDRVLVKLAAPNATEGSITKVLERGTHTLVGLFEQKGSYGFVVPDNRRFAADIFIPAEGVSGAAHNEKVVCEITDWGTDKRCPAGKITERLGPAGDNDADILSIVRSHGFATAFPAGVLKEADAVPETISEADLEGRLDLRDKPIITIDGADAKDLDDAVCVERLNDGYRLYVSIADVSHYVRQNSALDKEAAHRGTSVYVVDRVVPMLPKRLSNGICSLNPHADRLTLSVIMEIDRRGAVTSYEIKESVIRTVHRMTYRNVYRLLTERPAELAAEYADILPQLEDMRDLAALLNRRRQARGSINFNVPEAKIVLDEHHRMVDIVRQESTLAENIIEEFMLIANETVAEHAFWADLPFVYRIHEAPDEEKIHALSAFLYNLGYQLKGEKDLHPKEIQKLVEAVAGKPEETVISTLALRCMMKACYSPENTGHYGLAAKYYCHFTSPIRRYPDLLIHRILKAQLHGGLSAQKEAFFAEIAVAAAEHSSQREKAAEFAERDTEDLKKAEFMADKIGEEYEGIVSSVTSFGFFVQLENTVEGLVRVETLTDDYYVYDRDRYCLLGERTKSCITIGDAVHIRVEQVDVSQRQIDFSVVGMRPKKIKSPQKKQKQQKKRSNAQTKKFVKRKKK